MSWKSRALGKAMRAAFRDTRTHGMPYVPVSISSMAAKMSRDTRRMFSSQSGGATLSERPVSSVELLWGAAITVVLGVVAMLLLAAIF